MNNNENELHGKPWKIKERFVNFKDADNLRKKMLETEENLQVKVKRSSNGFLVKIRSTIIEKKNKKTRKRKKNAVRRSNSPS